MQRDMHSQDMKRLAFLTRKESHVSREIYGPLKVKNKEHSQHSISAKLLIQRLDIFTVFVYIVLA